MCSAQLNHCGLLDLKLASIGFEVGVLIRHQSDGFPDEIKTYDLRCISLNTVFSIAEKQASNSELQFNNV